MLDIIIHSASQVVTCAGGNAGAASHGGFAARRGRAMRDVNLIPNGAVAISDGVIVAVDSTENIRAEYTARDEIDASGRVVCPGFVDAHTHLVFAGERVDEFELRIQGATYMEIMQAGGGIASSMRATRAASLAELVAQARRPLDEMLRLGTTTVEVKTGYGLDTASELKLLQAIVELDKSHPVDLVPTFLGAHALPPEFKGRTDDYVDLVVNEMLPAVRRWTCPCFATWFARKTSLTWSRRDACCKPGWKPAWRLKSTPTNLSIWAGWRWRLNWVRSPPTTWT